MDRENMYLSARQIKALKEILFSEKERITMRDGSKEDFWMQKDELLDVLDEANANIQASQMLRFRNREVFYLKKINLALDNIEQGVYGLCESCDAEIGFERLKARPTAQLCISCKEESELIERNNYFQNKSKSLGKTLSELGRGK